MGWRRDTFKPRLPQRAVEGRFAFCESVILEAERLLPAYRGVDGDHEGIVFLLGRRMADLTIYSTAVAPRANHSAGRVQCSHEDVAEVLAFARPRRLALLGQVHTHPGEWTEHSRGDDRMITMPFQGMLSIVVPRYGLYGLRPLESLGIHQYQSGTWVGCTTASIREALVVWPASADLR